MVVSQLMPHVAEGPSSVMRIDPSRIEAGVVSGIGFLGAGTIVQARGAVHGLTTSACVIIDSSKYLDRILEVNPDEKGARVEPGVPELLPDPPAKKPPRREPPDREPPDDPPPPDEPESTSAGDQVVGIKTLTAAVAGLPASRRRLGVRLAALLPRFSGSSCAPGLPGQRYGAAGRVSTTRSFAPSWVVRGEAFRTSQPFSSRGARSGWLETASSPRRGRSRIWAVGASGAFSASGAGGRSEGRRWPRVRGLCRGRARRELGIGRERLDDKSAEGLLLNGSERRGFSKSRNRHHHVATCSA